MKWSKKQVLAFSIYISTISAYAIESNILRFWLFKTFDIKEETWGYVIMILVPTILLSVLIFFIVYPILRKVFLLKK